MPVHVRSRHRPRVLVDRRVRARPGHVPDRVQLVEDQPVVADRERVAIHRAHRRAGRAVPLRVVLAAVARAAERLREHRAQLDVADLRHPLLVDRPVRLHRASEVDAAAVEDREARQAALREAVEPDEGRPARDLALLRVREVGRDDVLALGEVLHRPEVDLVLLDVREGREDHEPEHRQREHAAHDGGEADQRDLEEAGARVGGKRLLRRPIDVAARPRAARASISGTSPRTSRVTSRAQSRPKTTARIGADQRDRPADHEPQEEERDTDREPDRPQARSGRVRGVGTVRAQPRGILTLWDWGASGEPSVQASGREADAFRVFARPESA